MKSKFSQGVEFEFEIDIEVEVEVGGH